MELVEHWCPPSSSIQSSTHKCTLCKRGLCSICVCSHHYKKKPFIICTNCNRIIENECKFFSSPLV